MADYRLRPKARSDLREIWRWTSDAFSERQADNYLAGLRGEFERLSSDARQGLSVDEAKHGYRKLNYRRHLIVFIRTSVGVEIARVLHQSMNIAAHLSDEE